MIWHLKAFHELSVDELYDILKLRSEIFVVEQTCVYLDPDGKDKKACHLWAEEDGKVIASLRILPQGVSYEEASIGRIVVREDHRGAGIARQLLQKGLEAAKDMGETSFRIAAQAHLSKFYGSFGFQEISEIYIEDGIPHVDMLYLVEEKSGEKYYERI